MKKTELQIYNDICSNLDDCIDGLFDYYNKNRAMPHTSKEGMLQDIHMLMTIHRSLSKGGE